MRGVLFKTLGCRLNQAESSEMEGALVEAGLSRATGDGEAEIVVVNTCTVTADSSRSSRQLIRRTVRANPSAEIVVTGCYAVAAPDEVAAIDGVAAVIPNKDKDVVVEVLRNRFPEAFDSDCAFSPAPAEPKVRTTLKVQTGCDEGCTFCIVPSTRGGLSSRVLSGIEKMASEMSASGAKEVTLTGVHLGKYGVDLAGQGGLEGLVRSLLVLLPEDVRIRLSSLEATTLGDGLIELVANDPRVCRHLHLPLQSGDRRILAAMGRPYSPDEFLAVVERARSAIEGLALTTDVMVGFPGEDDAAFDATCQLVRAAGFTKLHVFRYSPREGTPAASMGGQVPEEVKRERSRILRAIGDSQRLDFHRRQAAAGKLKVLVEAAGRAFDEDPGRPSLFGITDNYVKVETSGPAGLVGKLVEVEPVEVGVEAIRSRLLGLELR